MLSITSARYRTLFAALVLIVGFVVQLPSRAAAQTSELPAFPGAQGYGASSKGGRNGTVILVTNLNDSGAGSLRAALDASGPRIIVFRVGGVIALKSRIDIDEPFVTIAGQSAPGDGIVIRNHPLAIRTHNVTIRGLRMRLGIQQTDDSDLDGIKVTTLGADGNVENIIVDHSSISWAGDEPLSLYNTDKNVSSDGRETFNKNGTLRNVSVQWSVVSEGLRDNVPNQGTSFGALIGDYVENVSFHHNLMAHNADRNAAVNAGVTAELVNNVVYNWEARATVISGFDHDVNLPSRVNVIGNYYKKGPDTTRSAPEDRGIIVDSDFAGDAGSDGSNDTASRFHVRGNVGPNRPQDAGDEWNAVHDKLDAPVSNDDYRVTSRAASAPRYPVTEHAAADAYHLVLDQAGALAPQRDAVDQRIVNEVRDGNGKIITSVSQVGGYPSYNNPDNNNPQTDSDEDGMPDTWELTHGLNPMARNDAQGSNMTAPSGYMWVEEYLNSLLPSGEGGLLEGIDDEVEQTIPSTGGEVTGWSTSGGKWTIESNQALRQSSTSGTAIAVAESENLVDFVLETRITPADFASGGKAAVYVRFADVRNFYRLDIAPGSKDNVTLRKRVDGTDTTLKRASSTIAEGRTYELRLEVIGPSLKAYLDGKLVAEAIDASLLQGQLAVGTYNASSRFSNVTLK